MKYRCFRYEYSLIRGIEQCSIGSLCLFKIKNFHTMSAMIGLDSYESLFVDLQQKIALAFGGSVFQYGYHGFFILAKQLDSLHIINFIDNYSYRDYDLHLTYNMGFKEFDLLNAKENPVQIINSVLEVLNYADQQGIKCCKFELLAEHLLRAKKHMHDAMFFKHYGHTDKFLLRFQPIVAVQDDAILFNEVLLKIDFLDHSVEQFVMSLEKTGLINNLDIMVLNRMQSHIANFPDHHFSINVSPMSIIDEDAFAYYLKTLQSFANPLNLILEITETSVIRDLEKISKFIHEAKRMGFRVAIDDFGSGSTSFRDLMNLDVDIIKLSGNLISKLDQKTAEIIGLINNFAAKFNIVVVAECVENQAVLERLKALNIHYMQGYYFADVIKNSLSEIKLNGL